MTTLNWTPEDFAPSHRYLTSRSTGARVFSRAIRPRSRPSTRRYVCQSRLMDAADRDELERVWGLTDGSATTFDWTPPRESAPRTCRFVGPELTFTEGPPGTFATLVEIEVT